MDAEMMPHHFYNSKIQKLKGFQQFLDTEKSPFLQFLNEKMNDLFLDTEMADIERFLDQEITEMKGILNTAIQKKVEDWSKLLG